MKFETKLERLGIDENEVKSIIMNCECGEINGAYFIDLTKEKKQFIMEVIGNYLDDDSEEFEGWTDIKRISTFCKTFNISEDEIPKYYRLGFNEGGVDIAYELESNKDVLLVLTDDERYYNSFIQYSPSQKSEEETETDSYTELFDKIKEAETELHEIDNYSIREKTEDGKGYIVDLNILDELILYHSLIQGKVIYNKSKIEEIIKSHTGIIKDSVIKRISDDIDLTYVRLEFGRYNSSKSSENYDEESEENWVGFKIVSKADDRIYLAGQFDISSYDEDTDLGDWEYEQNDGSYESHLPRYWKVDGESLSFEYGAFIDCIDWDIFRQYLFDFADENKSIDMGTYFIHINEGATIEIDIEEEVGFDVMHHIAKLTFKYNRQPIEFDKNILTDLRKELIFDEDGFNINDGWSSVRIIVPKFFDDEESIDEQDEIIQEWIEDVKQAFARQLSRDAGIYTDYGENIEQLVEEDIASDKEQMFLFNSAVSRNCVKDWMIENAYLYE